MTLPANVYCPEFLRLFFVQWFYNWSFQYLGPRRMTAEERQEFFRRLSV